MLPSFPFFIMKSIENWINRLDRYGICPFAKKSKRLIIEGNISNLEQCINSWDNTYEIIIFVYNSYVNVDYAEAVEKRLNNIRADVLVLLDHFEFPGYIEENSTCNDSGHIVYLLQNKKKLMAARKYLHTTNYYDNWTAEYYEQVVKDTNDL